MKIATFDRANKSALENGVIGRDEFKKELSPMLAEAKGSTKAAVLRRVDGWAVNENVKSYATMDVIANMVEKITDGEKTFNIHGVRALDTAEETGKSLAHRRLESMAEKYNELTDPDHSHVEVYSLGKRNHGFKTAALRAADLPTGASTHDCDHMDAADGIRDILSWQVHTGSLGPLTGKMRKLLHSPIFANETAESFTIKDQALRGYRDIDNAFPVKLHGFVSTTKEGEALAVLVSGGG